MTEITTPKPITFSLRARMTLAMVSLLLFTLATVQYLNQQAQQRIQTELENQHISVTHAVNEQFHDVISATNIGIAALTANEYLYELVDTRYKESLNRTRIRHILMVAEDGSIEDSTEEIFLNKKVTLPVGEGSEMGIAVPGDPVSTFEESADTHPEAYETYWYRTTTTSGVWWIGVVVSTEGVSTTIINSQRQLAAVIQETADRRLQATLGVFALAALLTILLVWQLMAPIRELSRAAERVALGDLDFKVGIRRRDEIGQLSQTFDHMIEGLKAKAELEERLNNAERAAVIGRLTAAIAHEIRNPLNFINLSIDHVRSKFPPAEERDRQRFDRLLGSIKDELARLNRLVTDVLNFGRPANLNFRKVDLREVIEQVLALVRPRAEEEGIEIVTAMPDEPAMIEADAEKLKSCFSNIVINAIQAMPGGGGSLNVSLDRKGNRYRARFTDTGDGIPAHALDRVFEPYYSTKDTGTGLGLAVTKKIVDEHRGVVTVESVAGLGTTFEVDLPITRQAIAEETSIT